MVQTRAAQPAAITRSLRRPATPVAARRGLRDGLDGEVHVDAPELDATIVVLRGRELIERRGALPVRSEPAGPAAARRFLESAPQRVALVDAPELRAARAALLRDRNRLELLRRAVPVRTGEIHPVAAGR